MVHINQIHTILKHMNISEIGLSINGQPVPYSEPLKLNFGNDGNGEHIRAYHALFHWNWHKMCRSW